jgi:hypothetical protein
LTPLGNRLKVVDSTTRSVLQRGTEVRTHVARLSILHDELRIIGREVRDVLVRNVGI